MQAFEGGLEGHCELAISWISGISVCDIRVSPKPSGPRKNKTMPLVNADTILGLGVGNGQVIKGGGRCHRKPEGPEKLASGVLVMSAIQSHTAGASVRTSWECRDEHLK